MTQIPAGWYPDPDPQAPEPKGQRYWDGQQWTEHVSPPPGQPVLGQPTARQPLPGEAVPGQAYGAAPAYTPMAPYAGSAQVAARATTPDGQELSGWWLRVVAYLIDGVIVGIISGILAFPWMSDIVDSYVDFISATIDATESGTSGPSQTELLSDVAGPVLVVTLIGLAVSLVYNSAFLRWKAATPGKLALGLRSRLRERPGRLDWGTILKRWVSQFGYVLLSPIPVLGSVVGLYPLIDGLWPLWDSRKQALHDKIAATNVVRVRRTS